MEFDLQDSRRVRPFLLIALFFSCVLSAVVASDVATEGAEAGRWTMDYEAAVALADEKDLAILLNFTGSDWCGWCKLMDEAVYAKDEWKEYATSKLVLVTLDFPRDTSIVPEQFVEQNERLREKYAVRGYPTYLILDSDGETRLGQLGAGRDMTPAKFIEQVEGVLRFRSANVEAKVDELGEEKGAAYRAAVEEFRAAETALKDWIATRPPRNEENEAKFSEFLEAIEEAGAKIEAF